jgi:hypothetical protein
MEDVNNVDATTTPDANNVNIGNIPDVNTVDVASTQDDKAVTSKPLYPYLPWLKRTMTAALPQDTLAEIVQLLSMYHATPSNISQLIKWMLSVIYEFEDIRSEKQSELIELQSLLDAANDKYKSLETLSADLITQLKDEIETLTKALDRYENPPSDTFEIVPTKKRRVGVWALLNPNEENEA